MSTQIFRGARFVGPSRSHFASSQPISRRATSNGQAHAPADGGRKKAPRSHGWVPDTAYSLSTNPDEVVLLRLPEVRSMTGLSKSTLYALIREGSFPTPIRLGPRAVAWIKSEVQQWALDRVRESRVVA